MLRGLLLVGVLWTTCAVAHGQRYFADIVPNAVVTRNIVYGAAPDYLGVPTTLLLDVYEPEGDAEQQRPLVVLVHGGGFTGGGKAGESMQVWGTALARRGFVAVSIDYRLGTPSKTDPVRMWEASLRAGQDVRAAVRYMRSTAHVHRIDTSRIYLVGTSAGGFAILQASVLDDDEVLPGIDPTIGSVEGASGTPNESSRVHGLVVCWGATTDTTMIEAGDPPIIAVHGTQDKTVPYQCGPSKFGFDLCGAEPLTRRASNVGIRSALTLFHGAGHTLDGDPALIDSCFRFYAYELALLATTADPTSVLTQEAVAEPSFRIERRTLGLVIVAQRDVVCEWYDLLGRRLATVPYPIGTHHVDIPGAFIARELP